MLDNETTAPITATETRASLQTYDERRTHRTSERERFESIMAATPDLTTQRDRSIYASFVEGFSYAQTAAALGIAQGSVPPVVARVRHILQTRRAPLHKRKACHLRLDEVEAFRKAFDVSPSVFTEIEREAVTLCYFEAKSKVEAADLLGVRYPQLATRLARAQAKLARVLAAGQVSA